jgi:GNAT superfamily N-acetyltransferase
VSGPETVRGLQERAARALPAEHVEDAGGWWLRHAPNCSWWVGTVLPHGGTDDLVLRIAGAEEFYARRGAVARFQISPGACPDGLDAALAGRGYRRQSPVSLQVAAVDEVLGRASSGGSRVRVDERPDRGWFAVWHAVNGGGGRSERDLLARVDRPSAYASVLAGRDVVAVGRAVADDGWAGVFGMATLPTARGRGAARVVLAARCGWAADQGAAGVYLQVESDNAPALRVYERAGFRELCAYHYRTAPPGSDVR